jgi:hypothetical protein
MANSESHWQTNASSAAPVGCQRDVTGLHNSCRREGAATGDGLREGNKTGRKASVVSLSAPLPRQRRKKCWQRLKRSASFLHYPNKWKTSRSAAMSHTLGSQPGNSRLGPSKVPEPTGKRLRRFVHTLLHAVFLDPTDWLDIPKGVFSSLCMPPAPSRRPDAIAAITRL